jgi:hypothetical protein
LVALVLGDATGSGVGLLAGDVVVLTTGAFVCTPPIATGETVGTLVALVLGDLAGLGVGLLAGDVVVLSTGAFVSIPSIVT